MIEVMRGNNVININNKEQSNWNKVSYAILIAASLLINKPTQATTQTINQQLKNIIELTDTTNLLDKMNKKFGMSLPYVYNNILRDFISDNAVLNYNITKEYTENFITKQMSYNRGIPKENQYFFIRCSIYTVLTNEELYDGSDNDETIYKNYEIAFDYILNCEDEYNKLLEKVIKDDLQKSKDDLQKSKDDLQKSKDDVMASDILLLNEIVRFYNLHKSNSNLLTAGEIQEVKRIAKETIKSCNKHGIDYKAYFLEKLGDSRKVEELLRICEIE